MPINDNKNNIVIPWYKNNIQSNMSNMVNNVPISNVRFNIILPNPEPQPQEQEQPQEETQTQEQTQTQTETETNRVKFPYNFPFPFPVPAKNPNGEQEQQPVENPVFAIMNDVWKDVKSLGIATWNNLSVQQREDLLYTLANTLRPDMGGDKLRNGVKYAVGYNYTSNFNASDYMLGLTSVCGIEIAVIIILIVATAIPGVPPL